MKDDPDFMRRISLDLAVRKAACRILDVEEDADQEQLQKAYRRAAIRYHPDHNGSTVAATRMFALVKCAYDLLALDKPCDAVLVTMDSWLEAPQDDQYRLDNPWGHFCWWREKFFGTGGTW
jgi:hypothetical protein